MDPQCRHVIARDDEHRRSGTGRLTPEHKIGRMAVLREWRGRGVGEALLLALVSRHARSACRRFHCTRRSMRSASTRSSASNLGERFEEAGIPAPVQAAWCCAARARTLPPARAARAFASTADFEGLEGHARGRCWRWCCRAQGHRRLHRDLEPALFAHPPICRPSRISPFRPRRHRAFRGPGSAAGARSPHALRPWPSACHRFELRTRPTRRSCSTLGLRRHGCRRLPVPPARQPLRGRLEPGAARAQPAVAGASSSAPGSGARPCTDFRSLQSRRSHSCLPISMA
jgi:GNAT superfamily N-acetyltransferase